MLKVTERDVDSIMGKTGFYLTRWKYDPVAFVVEACRADRFGWPTQQQAELLRSVARNDSVAIHSGRGIGKTRCMAWVIWWFMTCWKRETHKLKILITSPTGGQISDVIWSEMEEVRGHMLPWIGDKFEVNADGMFCKEAKELWFCTPRTASPGREHSMAGMHGDTLTLVDESSEVPDKTFHTLDSGRTDEIAKMLAIGNPTKRLGWFSDVCHGTIPGWAVHHISCLDTLSTDERPVVYSDPFGEAHVKMVPGQVNPRALTKYTADDHQIYYPNVLGLFPLSDTSQLIKSEWVDSAWKRKMEEHDIASMQPAVMGVDIADDGIGGDETGFVIRRGSAIEEGMFWNGHSLTESAERIIRRWKELDVKQRAPVHVNVDSTGIGAGVADMLRKAGLPVRRAYGQEAAFDTGGTKCNRMRDSMWWSMKEWFRNNRVRWAEHDDQMELLKNQVMQPTYNQDNGKVKVEGKKEMKKRGIPSPDRADALALTFYTNPKAARVEKEKQKKLNPEKPAYVRMQGEPRSWFLA